MSQNLIHQAVGVDLVVHEVASPESFQRAGVRPERANSVIAHHVTSEQAGEVFAKTKPRLAVYSHIVQPDVGKQDLILPTRKNYAGPVRPCRPERISWSLRSERKSMFDDSLALRLDAGGARPSRSTGGEAGSYAATISTGMETLPRSQSPFTVASSLALLPASRAHHCFRIMSVANVAHAIRCCTIPARVFGSGR
jgi:hypothetical protein